MSFRMEQIRKRAPVSSRVALPLAVIALAAGATLIGKAFGLVPDFVPTDAVTYTGYGAAGLWLAARIRLGMINADEQRKFEELPG